MDELVVQTQTYRKDIISYVYRLTGSIEEAKDITQETILKYISLKDVVIENPKAWMFKVATNLSLDFFRKAKTKREMYIGPWLPEPYIEESFSVEEDMELDESLGVALLVLMEKLSSKERIAYILHDLFDFKHKEIANILNTSSQNSRQLTSRANKKLKSKEHKYSPSKKEHLALTKSFLKAIKEGDFNDLKDIFKADVELHSDGGGKVIAARKVLYGDNTFVSKFLIKVTSSLFEKSKNSVELKLFWFNGSPGLVLIYDGIVVSSYSFEIKNNKISRIYSLRNPDKLKFFN